MVRPTIMCRRPPPRKRRKNIRPSSPTMKKICRPRAAHGWQESAIRCKEKKNDGFAKPPSENIGRGRGESGAVQALPALHQMTGDSRFRGNGGCFNFASSLYFHFCPVFYSSFPIPAPFFHSRPSFHSAPPSIPTLFPFPPPFPIPAKAGISRLLRQRRKLQCNV